MLEINETVSLNGTKKPIKEWFYSFRKHFVAFYNIPAQMKVKAPNIQPYIRMTGSLPFWNLEAFYLFV